MAMIVRRRKLALLIEHTFLFSIYFQANSSIFVQSQTDFINGTTAVAKKTETCIGRWEHGTLEPLQIQVSIVLSLSLSFSISIRVCCFRSKVTRTNGNRSLTLPKMVKYCLWLTLWFVNIYMKIYVMKF